MNAYEQLDFVRDIIGESVAAHWSSLGLLRRLNLAQKKLAAELAMTPGDWFVKSSTVTLSDGAFTLPVDCSKPLYLEDATGSPVNWLSGGIRYRRVSRALSGTPLIGNSEAYSLGNTVEINAEGVSGTYTLWYQRRVPDLHCGFAGANCAESALHLDTSTTEAITSNDLGTGSAIKFVDNYYEGVYVEIIDSTSGITNIKSQITAFTASTALATITGTPSENDVYGTVSILPEECHQLMAFDTAILALMKPGAKLDKEALQYIRAEYASQKEIFIAWASSRIAKQDDIAIGRLYEY